MRPPRAGDYVDALGWLDLLEHMRYQLPTDYDTKRQAWLAAITGSHPVA